jgi:hypothetical protein
MSPARILLFLVLLLSSAAAWLPGLAQAPNQRLILKDGSYQVVTKYQKVGDRVRYFSAERAQWEELPGNLVDWAATETWAKDHKPGAQPPPEPVQPAQASPVSPAIPEAAKIDKEEQRARARTPYVSPGLRLPDQDGVWALDTFHDQPELVALTQNAGGVNRETGHNVLRSALNPLGGMKQSVEIPGAESRVKLHVNDPALYVSITGADDNEADPAAVTVETHGASSVKDKNGASSANSQYAIVRVRSNFKKDYRQVSGINIAAAGKVTQTEDVIPTTSEVLPGDRWVKLTPKQPLTIGDYALMELLGPGEVNLSVWDFRIDPQGPDNKNALIPLQRSSDNDR